MIHRRSTESVELNITAMLDMAFQLLAFFILTFHASPLEPGFLMHMPPADPILGPTTLDEPIERASVIPAGINTLRICILSAGGGIDQISINDSPVENLSELRARMKSVLADPAMPFEQVALQVSPALRYQEVIELIGLCSEQKLPTTDRLPRLSMTMIANGR